MQESDRPALPSVQLYYKTHRRKVWLFRSCVALIIMIAMLKSTRTSLLDYLGFGEEGDCLM